jgi:predicted amidophosphoribosyltransferase
MSFPQLMVANCPRCHKVYQKNNRDMCMDCTQEMLGALSKCIDFLRKNHRSTCEEVSQATSVASEQILAWIKEGKLLISDYPNLNYPCSTCGKAIRQHKMCTDCSLKLSREIRTLNEEHEKKLNSRTPNNYGVGFQIRDRFGRRV